MKRMIAALLALALVVPQFAVAQPAKVAPAQTETVALQAPTNLTAEATQTADEVTVTVEWNSPSAYFGSNYEFEFKVAPSNMTTSATVPQTQVNGAPGGRFVVPASMLTSDSVNTILVRAHNTANETVSNWVATSANVPPQSGEAINAQIGPNGGTLVARQSALVGINTPFDHDLRFTVGYVPSGETAATQERVFNSQPEPAEYLFTPFGPGQIRVRFESDESSAPTDVWSNIFTTVPPPLNMEVIGGDVTVIRGATATATVNAVIFPGSMPLQYPIRVGYVVGGQISQEETLYPGMQYTFTANQTGQVRAFFPSNSLFATTTANSGVYTVVDNPLPLTVTGGGTVSYGTTQTATVTIPDTVTAPVRVGYQVTGQPLSQVTTVTSGVNHYTFVAKGTGQVVASFAGNSQFNATTQRSGVYTVKPKISAPTVSATKVGIYKNISAMATIKPKQARASDVGFRCYHLERQSDGTSKYVLRTTVVAAESITIDEDTSRFSANFDLSRVGRWHIVAFYAGSDTLEAHQGSSRTVTVVPVISKANAPSSARRLRNFTVTASIMPRQSSNTFVRFRCYHREKQRNGTFKYVLRKTVTPKVTTINSLSSLLTGRFSLPLRGTWRIAAYYKGSPNVPAVQGVGDSIVIR